MGDVPFYEGAKALRLAELKKIKNTNTVSDEMLADAELFALERVFQKARRYDYKFGKKTKSGLKSVQEITVAKITVQNLAEYCVSEAICSRACMTL